MATLPIRLEVEAEAVGPVMIALSKMPGIIKMKLEIGEGPGPAAAPRAAGGTGNGAREAILELFKERKGGPLSLEEISAVIGGGKSRSYGAVHYLKKLHVLRNVDKGVYQFTAKAMAAAGLTLALPAPAKKAKTAKPATTKAKAKTKAKPYKAGRVTRGIARAELLLLLTQQPSSRGEIDEVLGKAGVATGSTGGVLERARRDGLVKLNGTHYELTAKGRGPKAANGTVPAAAQAEA
ncbi:MAG TPA: hypothetical protein VHT00_14085 [Stellaceae bacterium]|jgi:hypothetical protein|nr:hypothetical protein [Stellaceae bacterium]